MRRGQRRPDGTGGGRSGSPADADFASDGVIVGGAAACFAGALVENACSVIAPSSIAGLGAGHSAISDPPPTGAGSVARGAIGSDGLATYKIVALETPLSIR